MSATRYAKAGDVNIAWAAHGDGPIDIVFCSGFLSHVEHLMAHPAPRGLFERLGRFARVLLFDRRGSGLSDRSVGAPTLEEQMQDVIAVMDAAGSERAALIGFTGGAPLAILAAATHPERCSGLILLCGFARNVWAPDYDFAQRQEDRDARRDHLFATWGSGERGRVLFPRRAGDPTFISWFAALERLSSGPGDALHVFHLLDATDVRHVLPTVHVPTLVMHPAETPFIDVRHSEYLAEHIPGARLLRYPGSDALPTERSDHEAVVGEIEELLTGAREVSAADRSLATVLFTDIVGSTERAAREGDDVWALTLEGHEQAVRDALRRYNGRAVKGLGDGFLATFEGPTSAVRCALDLAADTSVPIRAGLHTGEIERFGGDIRGLAVHIGARVAAMASAGEVLVSQTVKDLTVGSGLSMEDRGEHELKGVPGRWRVHRVAPD